MTALSLGEMAFGGRGFAAYKARHVAPSTLAGMLLPPRFFDRALRTVREYHEKVQYIHVNPFHHGVLLQ